MMSQLLELGYRRDGRDVVVSVRGEIDLSSAPRFEAALADLIDQQGSCSIVLDLERLEFIDSTGLNAVLRAQQRAQEKGGEVALAHVPSRTRRVFAIAGVLSTLNFREEDDTVPQ